MSHATPTALSMATADTRHTEANTRWRAVLANDAACDGRFVYAVHTTGVYCRPSCRSRAPRRDNVYFFATPAAAEQAGYRPCKRCRPDRASASIHTSALVARACRLLERAEQPPRLTALAREVGASPSHLHRLFRRMTGLTPREYANAARDKRLRAGLAAGARVTDAMLDAGYRSSGHLQESSARALGMTPTRFRAGGTDTTIRFAVGECTLGAILVAGTRRGVCAISLGDDPEPLVDALQARFARARLIGGDRAFEDHVARLVGFVEAPGLGLDLPLDIQGTAFQQRVWQALCEIPVGETASYAAIARRLGTPSAARAVAAACAANELALAIPCHRVVRSDGGLSGYRWGVERKRALLERESVSRRNSDR